MLDPGFWMRSGFIYHGSDNRRDVSMIMSESSSRSYRDLEVYKLAHALGVRVHTFSMEFPKCELYETGSQARRASKSISANIVEGYGGRRYKAEFIIQYPGSRIRHRVSSIHAHM